MFHMQSKKSIKARGSIVSPKMFLIYKQVSIAISSSADISYIAVHLVHTAQVSSARLLLISSPQRRGVYLRAATIRGRRLLCIPSVTATIGGAVRANRAREADDPAVASEVIVLLRERCVQTPRLQCGMDSILPDCYHTEPENNHDRHAVCEERERNRRSLTTRALADGVARLLHGHTPWQYYEYN